MNPFDELDRQLGFKGGASPIDGPRLSNLPYYQRPENERLINYNARPARPPQKKSIVPQLNLVNDLISALGGRPQGLALRTPVVKGALKRGARNIDRTEQAITNKLDDHKLTKILNELLLSPTLKSTSRVSKGAAGENVYQPGMRGVGQAVTDAVNIAGVLPAGKAIQAASRGKMTLNKLGKAGMANIPFGAAGGLGAALERGETNVRDIAGDVVAGAGLGYGVGVAAPVVGRAAGRTVKELRAGLPLAKNQRGGAKLPGGDENPLEGDLADVARKIGLPKSDIDVLQRVSTKFNQLNGKGDRFVPAREVAKQLGVESEWLEASGRVSSQGIMWYQKNVDAGAGVLGAKKSVTQGADAKGNNDWANPANGYNSKGEKFKSPMEALEDPAFQAKVQASLAQTKKPFGRSSNLYHTTSAENLESIAKQGLLPNQKPRFEGVSNGKISFGANEKTASYYGKPGDVLIRTKASYVPENLETDLLAGGEGAYMTSKAIPPEALEVKIKGKWQPLVAEQGKIEAWQDSSKTGSSDLSASTSGASGSNKAKTSTPANSAAGGQLSPQSTTPDMTAQPSTTYKSPAEVVNSNPKTSSSLKQRGFAKTLESTDDPSAQLIAENIPGYKPITNKSTLARAARIVDNDPEATFARLVTKKQLDSADDVAVGNLLLHRYIEEDNISAALEVGRKLGLDGTKLGQAVQAYSTWKKTTPEGILREASKQAFKAGREVNPEVARELVAKAKAIIEMPEGYEKAIATRELLGQAKAQGRTWVNAVEELLNVPRALMATGDFSAPGRQGAFLGSRYPKEWASGFKEQFKYWKDPKYYEKEMYKITQRPSYPQMKAYKLAVDGAEQLTGSEEQFLHSVLESDLAKKLVVGRVVSASDRAYSGFLTKFRADVFDKITGDARKAGIRLGKTELESLAKFINSASGRGQGKVTDQISRLQVLFSARLWKSRLDMLNPAYYARLKGPAKKLALQTAGSFAGMAGTVLTLASAIPNVEIETDARSADFAKIKIGNTRYDILGGLQQNIRLAAQLITGEKINSTTGEIQTLGPDRGYGKPSRMDLMYQFIENKENPILAFATKLLRGTNQIGEPINVASEAGKMAVPLVAQGTYETIKDVGSVGKGLAMSIPNVFGVGTQTYGTTPTKDKVAGKTAEGKTDDGTKRVESAYKEGRIPEGIDQQHKSTLEQYYKADEKSRKQWLDNPDNYLAYEVAKYERDKAEGKLTDTQDYERRVQLARVELTKDFSREVRDYYGWNRDKQDAFSELNPEKAAELDEKARQMDALLLEAGFIARSKYASRTRAPRGSGTRASRGRVGRTSTGRVRKPRIAKAKAIKVPAIKFKTPKMAAQPKLATVLASLRKRK